MTKTEIASLLPADAEQRHVQDEIEHPEFVDQVTHDFAVCCGEQCACGEAGQ